MSQSEQVSRPVLAGARLRTHTIGVVTAWPSFHGLKSRKTNSVRGELASHRPSRPAAGWASDSGLPSEAQLPRRRNMTSRLYVRNLAARTTRDVLERAFSRWGEVQDTRILRDPNTGRQRGFAFVRMATIEGAKEAALRMDGIDLEGHSLRVNATRDPKRRLCAAHSRQP